MYGGHPCWRTVYREFELDGDVDGPLVQLAGVSAARNDLAGSNLVPATRGSVIGLADFVGDNSYALIGEDRKGLRRPEWGFEGVTVTVYGPGSSVVGSATTDAQGGWRVAHSLPAGTPLLVEYSGWPSWMASGPTGSENATSVVRTTVGPADNCAMDFTVPTPPITALAIPALRLPVCG